MRALGVARGFSCGSSPVRFGVLVCGGEPVPSVSVPTVLTGPVSQNTMADPLNGKFPIDGIIWRRGHGERPGTTAGLYARAPIVRASTSAVVSDT